MLRTLVGALSALVFFASVLQAEDIRGILKSVDAKKGILTITVGKDDRDFTITDDTKLRIIDAKDTRDPKDRLKDPVFQRLGLDVKVTTEQKDGKEVVKEVKVTIGKEAGDGLPPSF